MGADHGSRMGLQSSFKGVQLGLLVKKVGFGHPNLCPQGVQRAGNCVMLPGRNEHPVTRLYQRMNGNIETVGGVGGKHHLLGILHAKQLRCRLTAGKGGLCRPAGRQMASPARAGQISDGPGGGPGHRGWLLQRGSSAVQIDHSPTSR